MTCVWVRRLRISSKTAAEKRMNAISVNDPAVTARFTTPAISTNVVKPKRYVDARRINWTLSDENEHVNGTLLNLKKKASTRKTATTASKATCRMTTAGSKRKLSRIANPARIGKMR